MVCPHDLITSHQVPPPLNIITLGTKLLAHDLWGTNLSKYQDYSKGKDIFSTNGFGKTEHPYVKKKAALLP
jgi:hypothetical protein